LTRTIIADALRTKLVVNFMADAAVGVAEMRRPPGRPR
jgi:hypothetical protein